MRTRMRTLAAAFALAVLATMLPQLASPAAAGPVVNSFRVGDIVKIKTTWGGGFVTNFGGSEGSFLEGRIAQIHWNTGWDNANRFEVVQETTPAGGLRWFKLKNRWSGLCLTANELWAEGYLTQRQCTDHASRYFAVVNGFGGDVPIRNLYFHQNGLDMVVTQKTFEWVGSHLVMARQPTNSVDHSRQRWVVQTCLSGGVEQRNC